MDISECLLAILVGNIQSLSQNNYALFKGDVKDPNILHSEIQRNYETYLVP